MRAIAPHKLSIVHIPKTGGATVARAYGLEDTHHALKIRNIPADHKVITIFRNPWDRAFSIYYYFKARRKQRKDASPEHMYEYLNMALDAPLEHHGGPWFAPGQWRFVEGPTQVDRAYAFERFVQIKRSLTKWVGVPPEHWGHVHQNTLPIREMDYRVFMDPFPDLIERIRERDAEVIKIMGYEYERPYSGPVYIENPKALLTP